MITRRYNSGQLWVPSAAELNQWSDAAAAQIKRQRKFTDGPKRDVSFRPNQVVYVRNEPRDEESDPDVNLDAYHVIMYEDIIAKPADASYGSYAHVAFQRVMSFAGGRYWGILQEPIINTDIEYYPGYPLPTAGQDPPVPTGDPAWQSSTGTALVARCGITWAWVDIIDALDWGCGPVEKDDDEIEPNLESGLPGAEIIWKPEGTGLKFCLINIRCGVEVAFARASEDIPAEGAGQAMLVVNRGGAIESTGQEVTINLDACHGGEQISQGLDVLIARGWGGQHDGFWRVISADCEPEGELLPAGDWNYV